MLMARLFPEIGFEVCRWNSSWSCAQCRYDVSSSKIATALRHKELLSLLKPKSVCRKRTPCTRGAHYNRSICSVSSLWSMGRSVLHAAEWGLSKEDRGHVDALQPPEHLSVIWKLLVLTCCPVRKQRLKPSLNQIALFQSRSTGELNSCRSSNRRDGERYLLDLGSIMLKQIWACAADMSLVPRCKSCSFSMETLAMLRSCAGRSISSPTC